MYQSSIPFPVQTVEMLPAIFTQAGSGMGPAAILNQDYTVNGPTSPAAKGSIVQVFMTGEGKTTPTAVTGRVNTALPSELPVPAGWVNPPWQNSGPIPTQMIGASVAGQSAAVVWASEAPGAVSGLLQVNVRIPPNAPSGSQPIVITIGGSSSQTNNCMLAGRAVQCGVSVCVQ